VTHPNLERGNAAMKRAPFTYHRVSTASEAMDALPATPARIVEWIEAAGR
jgi:hypothetical protein